MLRKAAWIALFLCFVGAFSFAIWRAEQAQPPAHREFPEKAEPENLPKCEERSFWQRTECDPVAAFTGMLTLFTAVLAAVSIVQIRFLRRADETARRAANAARDAAEAAKSQSDVAEKQMLLAGRQADITEKQHAVGRLEFLATHRPRLRVRHVWIETAEHIGHPTLFFTNGADIKGALVVVNVGGTKAHIVSSVYRIFFSTTGLPMNSPLDEGGHELIDPGIAVDIGESVHVAIKDKIKMGATPPGDGLRLRQFDTEGWVIYVMGQIQYQDEGGHDRFMGFCRQWGSNHKFRAINDPDYEYED